MESHKNGKLEILDNVSIGNGVHISAGENIIISSGCLISSYVLITDIDHDTKQIGFSVSETPIYTKPTFIDENVFIGAGAKILAGTHLGKGCVIAANSVVRGIFPDYVVIGGMPAKIIMHYDFNSKSWVKVYS